MKHMTDVKLFYTVLMLSILTSSCAVAQPALPASGIMPMGQGATLQLWNAACNGLGLAEMWSKPLTDGIAYMALEAHEGWYGVVFKSTSATITGPKVQEMLCLTGNCVTPKNLQELVEHARNLGFEKVIPAGLPSIMRMRAAMMHEAWAAGQLAVTQARAYTGIMFVVPAGAFGVPPLVVPADKLTTDN